MTQKETLQILSLLSTAYPTVKLTDELVTLWVAMMDDVGYETALINLKNHIRTSKYPPTIAEVSASNGRMEANRQKIETNERLRMLEAWSGAASLPAGGTTNE